MVEEIINEIDLENDEHQETWIIRAWESFKAGLLGTLRIMNENVNYSFKIVALGMIIDTAQLLAFPLSNTSEFPWNDYYSWLTLEILYYAKLEFYISETNVLQNIIWYWLFLFAVGFNLALAFSVGYNFLIDAEQKPYILRTVQFLTGLFVTVLYQPILSQFCIIFAWAVDPSIMQGWPTENRILLGVTSGLISILFTLLALLAAASLYQQDPSVDDCQARPHARCELVSLSMKAIITFQQSMWDGPEHHYSLIFTILLTAVVVTYSYIFYLPYYDYRTTVFQAQLYSIYLWSGICVLIAKIVDNVNDAGPISLFYIGCFCVWKLTKEAWDLRRTQLENKTFNKIKNEYEAELKVRYTIILRWKTLKTPLNWSQLFSSKAVLDKQDQAYVRLIDEIEHFYFTMEKEFQDSSMLQLFIAQFYTTYKESADDAVVKVEKAATLNPKLDEEFLIYMHRKKSQQTSTDTIQSVTFASTLAYALNWQKMATHAQVRFWKALRSQDWEKLLKLSKIISKNIGKSKTAYTKLLEMKKYHSRLLKMYAYFQADWLNEIKEAEEFLMKASKIETKVIEDVDRDKIDLCLFEISADGTHFGDVLKINEDCQKLLIRPKSAIINSKFQQFMPFPFHEMFVENLTKTKVYLLGKSRQEISLDDYVDSYVLDSLGYINKISYFVTLAQETQKRETQGNSFQLNATPLFGIRRSIQQMNDEEKNEPSEQQIQNDGVKLTGKLESQWSSGSIVAPISPRPAYSQTLGILTSTLVKVAQKNKQLEPPGDAPSGSPQPIATQQPGDIRKVNLSVFLEEHPIPTLLLNQNYIVLSFNREAANLMGLTFDMCGIVKLNQYVFRFEESVKTVLLDSQKSGQMSTPEFLTYICTSLAKVIRIRLSFEEITYKNEKRTLIFIKPLPDLSKTTERFLKLLANFMITRVKDLPNMKMFEQYAKIAGTSSGEGDRHQDKSEALIAKMKQQIEEYNTAFSPELSRIRSYFTIILCLEALLFVGWYIATNVSYQDFVSHLEAVDKITDIQNESILLSNYMILLDFARQGVETPNTIEETLEIMTELMHTIESNNNEIKDEFPIDALEKVTVPWVSMFLDTISSSKRYEIQMKNLADAVSRQAVLVQKIVEQQPEKFDILLNSDSFWVFQNGRISIAESLEHAAIQYMDLTDQQLNGLTKFTIAFAVCELSLLLILGVLVVPQIKKSESIFTSVLAVINCMEPYIVKYLYKTSKENLEMLKADNYPDNKGKIASENQILRKIFNFRQNSIDNKIDENETVFRTNWKSIIQNRIVKRYLLFALFCGWYIGVLQTWYAQTDAPNQVRNAATLLKQTGTYNLLLHRTTINLSASIYFDDGSEEYESMQSAMRKVHNETSFVNKYTKFFRIGDDNILDYSYMYNLMKTQFDGVLIDDGCVGDTVSDCRKFQYGLVERGLFDSTNVFTTDVKFLVNEIQSIRNSTRIDRYNLLQSDINRTLNLDLKYLNSLVQALQQDILDYYKGQVQDHAIIQALVLALFIVSMFVFIFVIFRNVIRSQEKRKRLTRSMLLILPRVVVKKSLKIQRKIANLDYR